MDERAINRTVEFDPRYAADRDSAIDTAAPTLSRDIVELGRKP